MRKWWMAIWLLLGIACMWKAYDLLMLAIPTGKGSGCIFREWRNDRVKLGEIPSYIAAFFGLGMVLLFQVWVYWRKAVGLSRKMD
ncbi:hypothetical protein JQC72_02195 [Polycladomyces sp. WAk]|uniref:Uncharacterized protein n=1 Tax=Polycladomyces zharkentensis TaxID=2807616 RepID=A0ABS2WFU1_9BACL|nr:hypothetical protein [Polycladomyces sp. WAk]MBN2908331.1 hypothetical protein [Polycladomyces sp. WAk]